MKKEVNYKVNGEEWNKAQDKAFNKLNAVSLHRALAKSRGIRVKLIENIFAIFIALIFCYYFFVVICIYH